MDEDGAVEVAAIEEAEETPETQVDGEADATTVTITPPGKEDGFRKPTLGNLEVITRIT